MLSQHLPVDCSGQLGGAALELVDGGLDAGLLSHDWLSSQSSLQDTTQTSLRARAAKSFAMRKKTVGEQVAAFMAHAGANSADMAALVNKASRGQTNVQRQNIEQLVANDVGIPRSYLQPLSKAMGTTVDVLLAGRYRPGEAPAPAVEEAPNPSNELDAAISTIGRIVGKSDKITKLSLELLIEAIRRESAEIVKNSQIAEPAGKGSSGGGHGADTADKRRTSPADFQEKTTSPEGIRNNGKAVSPAHKRQGNDSP